MRVKIKERLLLILTCLFISLNGLYLQASQSMTKTLEDLNPPVYETGFKSTRPILKFELGNGLHNQLMSFIDGMVVAILFRERYDVVLPTLWGSAYFFENKSQPMTFGEVYDDSHFVECVSNFTGDSLTVFRQVPNGFVTENIAYIPKHDSRKVNSNNNWNSTQKALLEFARPRTVVNIGRFYARWDYTFSDIQSFQSRRNIFQCIKAAPAIHEVVTQAAKNIRLLYPSSTITAIHPRLEADWKEHCQKTRLTECWIDEEDWSSRLRTHFNVNSPILLLGGANMNTKAFEQNDLTVFTKHDVLRREELSSFHYTSSFAAVDFFLALEMDHFLGFMLSTMDVMIYERRLYECLPVDSIHTTYGSQWLEKVSAWSKSYFFYRLDDLACHFRMRYTCVGLDRLDAVRGGTVKATNIDAHVKLGLT